MKTNLLLIGFILMPSCLLADMTWFKNLSASQKRHMQNALAYFLTGTGCFLLHKVCFYEENRSLQKADQQKKAIAELSQMIWGKNILTDSIENKITNLNVEWDDIQNRWLRENIETLCYNEFCRNGASMVVDHTKIKSDLENAIGAKNLDLIGKTLDKLVLFTKAYEVERQSSATVHSGREFIVTTAGHSWDFCNGWNYF